MERFFFCLTPLNTSSLILSGFCTRPSESRNSAHLSRGCPLVTSGLGPSSTPWGDRKMTKTNGSLLVQSFNFCLCDTDNPLLTQVMSSNPGSSSGCGGRLGSWETREWTGESGGRRAALKKLVTLENPPNVVAYGSWINLCSRWTK